MKKKMIIDKNQKIELFDKFYTWLKEDGLKPKTSERLHRKKIFASLLANDEMTLENFKDFLKDFQKKETKKTKKACYQDIKILKQLTTKQIYKKTVHDFNFNDPSLLEKTNLNLEQLVHYSKDYEEFLIQELKNVSKGKIRIE